MYILDKVEKGNILYAVASLWNSLYYSVPYDLENWGKALQVYRVIGVVFRQGSREKARELSSFLLVKI